MLNPIKPLSALAAPCVAAMVLFAMPLTVQGEARVEFELVTEEGFELTGAREWLSALEGLDLAGVRVRGAKAADRPMLERRGTEAAPTYHVVGVLTAGNKLRLPGGTFGIGDKAAIAGWITKLKEGGEEGLTSKPVAFGLLPKQLVAVHDGLSPRVSFSTKGKSPLEVIEEIAGGLSIKVVTAASVQKSLQTGEAVADELQGLTSGTVLAALVRPLGLVLVPEKVAGGGVQVRIVDSRAAKESWPVGWPPKKPPKDVLPDLFKFLNVEIADTPLVEALEAIRGRLKVPLLLDHNSLARQRVDLKAIKSTYPKGNTFYGKILDQILFQAKLKYELRLDEADQPFLWVTTIRR